MMVESPAPGIYATWPDGSLPPATRHDRRFIAADAVRQITSTG